MTTAWASSRLEDVSGMPPVEADDVMSVILHGAGREEVGSGLYHVLRSSVKARD